FPDRPPTGRGGYFPLGGRAGGPAPTRGYTPPLSFYPLFPPAPPRLRLPRRPLYLPSPLLQRLFSPPFRPLPLFPLLLPFPCLSPSRLSWMLGGRRRACCASGRTPNGPRASARPPGRGSA